MSKFVEATLLHNFRGWWGVSVSSGPLNGAIKRRRNAVFPLGISGEEIKWQISGVRIPFFLFFFFFDWSSLLIKRFQKIRFTPHLFVHPTSISWVPPVWHAPCQVLGAWSKIQLSPHAREGLSLSWNENVVVGMEVGMELPHFLAPWESDRSLFEPPC